MSDGDRYQAGMVRTQSKSYTESDTDLIAVLPHQCQRWEIGGQQHVRQLIQDLKNLLPRLVDEPIDHPEQAETP